MGGTGLGNKTSGVRGGYFDTNPFSKEKCLQQALTGKYLVLTVRPGQLNQAFADNNYYDNCRGQGGGATAILFY